ncbi:MAG: hypothetical protein ISP90_17505 [Nevskia sp.]|nr:hypothetical protein [Nevskia sp.]
MHALIGGVALVLAIVFGLLAASVYVALLLGGGEPLPPACESPRKSGAFFPAPAQANGRKDPASTGSTRPR